MSYESLTEERLDEVASGSETKAPEHVKGILHTIGNSAISGVFIPESEVRQPKTEVIMIARPSQLKEQIEGQLVILPLADWRDQWQVVVH